MSKVVNYCFVPSLDNDEVLAVRVCEGPYTGTVFTVNMVKIEGYVVEVNVSYKLVLIYGVVTARPDIEIMERDSIDGIVEELVKDSLKSYKKEGEKFVNSSN